MRVCGGGGAHHPNASWCECKQLLRSTRLRLRLPSIPSCNCVLRDHQTRSRHFVIVGTFSTPLRCLCRLCIVQITKSVRSQHRYCRQKGTPINEEVTHIYHKNIRTPPHLLLPFISVRMITASHSASRQTKSPKHRQEVWQTDRRTQHSKKNEKFNTTEYQIKHHTQQPTG